MSALEKGTLDALYLGHPRLSLNWGVMVFIGFLQGTTINTLNWGETELAVGK